MTTNNFSDLGIAAPETKSFVGEKKKISAVLNRPITVFDFTESESKYGGNYISVQIAIGENKHVLFTGSKALIDTVKRIPTEKFPFTTIIVEEENGRLIFT